MQAIPYDQWKAEIIQDIETAANTTEKGDRFVEIILRERYQLSQDDAVNATVGGAGDNGADALIITDADSDQMASALIIQGKYGAAGDGFSPYQEFAKFDKGLQAAMEGNSPTDALNQCASVLKSGGSINYVFATIEALNANQQGEVNNVRAISNNHFKERVQIETVNLYDIYQEFSTTAPTPAPVALVCQGVQLADGVYLGAATLVDMYQMLLNYARAHSGALDSIYDSNVRKWLGKKSQSVNAGIAATLERAPERFVAYNNGVTIVCRDFTYDATGLHIREPQIVNGCQTTRTLYDFMQNKFAGQANQLAASDNAEPYRAALLPFKLIAVADFESEMVKDITRYSNKQNAVRGRDFLTLEESFQRLKQQLAQIGYFLEVQTGEYRVLPKSEQSKFPTSRLVNAFDGVRFYAASVLAKPHTAFGHSGNFTPGGKEFEDITEDLTAYDLLVPWLVAGDGEPLGYSVGAKWHATADDHRNQTRYFFAYMFFRILHEVLYNVPHVEKKNRADLYAKLQKLRDQAKASGTPISTSNTPYAQLLELADTTVATYMSLAKQQNWYADRNAFLKSADLLDEAHLLMATSATLVLKKAPLQSKVAAVLQ